MSVPSVLAAVVHALDAAQIPHMLTGSMAAAWHGAAVDQVYLDAWIDVLALQSQWQLVQPRSAPP